MLELEKLVTRITRKYAITESELAALIGYTTPSGIARAKTKGNQGRPLLPPLLYLLEAGGPPILKQLLKYWGERGPERTWQAKQLAQIARRKIKTGETGVTKTPVRSRQHRRDPAHRLEVQ